MTISNEIINKKWVLKERPIGMAKKSDFELQEEQMDDISENEILKLIEKNTEINKYIKNQELKKKIFVPNKLINIIV